MKGYNHIHCLSHRNQFSFLVCLIFQICVRHNQRQKAGRQDLLSFSIHSNPICNEAYFRSFKIKWLCLMCIFFSWLNALREEFGWRRTGAKCTFKLFIFSQIIIVLSANQIPCLSSYPNTYFYPFHLHRFCHSLWKAVTSSLILPTYSNLFIVYSLSVEEECKQHDRKICVSANVYFSTPIHKNVNTVMPRIQQYSDRTVRIKNVYRCPAFIITYIGIRGHDLNFSGCWHLSIHEAWSIF